MLEAAPALRAEGRFSEVCYEELVRSPRRVLGGLCEQLELPWQDALLDGDGGLRVVNTLRRPERDKWREASAELSSILPRIGDLQQRLGYPRDLG